MQEERILDEKAMQASGEVTFGVWRVAGLNSGGVFELREMRDDFCLELQLLTLNYA